MIRNNSKTSCDVCGRGTETGRAHHVPSERLAEPYRYTICTRRECDSLGNHLRWWLEQNPDWHVEKTFQELLNELDGHEAAKAKFTPKWDGVSRRRLPGRFVTLGEFFDGVTE